MADPFVGEIQMLPYSFPPRDWAWCDGSSLPVQQYVALYAILKNTYGGNSQSFALPNLIKKTPVHVGSGPGLTNRVLGRNYGEPEVTLNSSGIPSHTHQLTACNTAVADQVTPALNTSLGVSPSKTSGPKATWFSYEHYAPAASPVAMASGALGPAGTSTPQPHENRQPFLVLNFCISLQGSWPARP